MKDALVSLLTVMAVLGLVGCGKSGASPRLDGTEWVLTSLNSNSLVEGSNITMNFAEGRAGGFAGCNGYGGEYTAADKGILTIPEIAVTAQLCQTPEGVMQQEDAYIEALRSAATYQVMDDQLEIQNASGETTLVFAKKEEFPMDPADLVGTEWQLLSVNGSNPIEGSTITIAFAEGEISGNAGCRDYVGTYEASGDDIRFLFFNMIGSAELCSEVLMLQEGEYTTSLEWATNYRLSEGQLKILTARGEVLIYSPVPDEADTGHSPLAAADAEIF